MPSRELAMEEDEHSDSVEVMAIEDDGRIRKLLETVLSAEGYDVISASNGQDALELLDSKKPRVILLDLMMPGLDGWTFLRRIRERGVEAPVVIVSAIRDLDIEARRLGTDSLAKPFAVDDLVNKVEEHLGGPASQPASALPRS
jgi:DNA-binding response OmpR family regulator